MTVVVHKMHDTFDIDISRMPGVLDDGLPHTWGNPYRVERYGRTRCIEMYRQKLWKLIQSGAITRSDLVRLRGKRLGCYCSPQACHGDVLAAAAEWAYESLCKREDDEAEAWALARIEEDREAAGRNPSIIIIAS